MALSTTELAKASPNTIHLALLKIGAVVLSNTRRVRLLMCHSHPNRALSPALTQARGLVVRSESAKRFGT